MESHNNFNKNIYHVSEEQVKKLVEETDNYIDSALKIKKWLFANDYSKQAIKCKENLQVILNSDQDSPHKYLSILKELNQLRDDLDSQNTDLLPYIEKLLVDDLYQIDESEFAKNILNNNNRQSMSSSIHAALSKLDHYLSFGSEEDFLYHKKWNVSEKIGTYPVWDNFLEELNKRLDERNYKTLINIINDRFDISKKQLINFGKDKIEQNDILLPVKKEELEIWKSENILKALIDYMQEFSQSHDASAILKRGDEIYKKFIPALMNSLEGLRSRFNRSPLLSSEKEHVVEEFIKSCRAISEKTEEKNVSNKKAPGF